MATTLSIKQIGLKLLDRVCNPNFENTAIWAFLFTGFLLVAPSQLIPFVGDLQFDWPHFKGKLQVNNSPDWALYIGLAFIAYGGFALYRIKISPSVKRRDEIEALVQLLNDSSSTNVLLQEQFLALFKISASIPIIRFLLNSNDPRRLINDFRFGQSLVSFVDSKFKLQKSINLDRRLFLYSCLYYVISSVALIAIAVPQFPYLDLVTKKTLSSISFPLAILLFLIAAIVLEPIRSHSAAKRLLAYVSSSSTEHLRDSMNLKRLLSTIHTPTFDAFIEYGKTSFLLDRMLHFWEGFKARYSASNFHLYDEELNFLVSEFYSSLEKSLSFPQYFVHTNNPDLYKFDSRLEYSASRDLSAAFEEFIRGIWSSEEQFKALLTVVRRKFPEIDIEETNQFAWDEYVELYRDSSTESI